jgi:CRP/FNR family transcriptional regulator, polysaccharide utilization system transcription regulator
MPSADIFLLLLGTSPFLENMPSPNTSNQRIIQKNCLLPGDVKEIRDNTQIVLYQKRDVIFRQFTPTSHIMYVMSGLVKIYKEGRNKRNFILKIAAPGDCISLMSDFGNVNHQYSASAILPAEIGYIDRQVFDEALKKNPELAVAVIRKLSTDGLFIFERLIGQSHKQLPGRIADVILYFADEIFKCEEFEFPLTRRELAELAGTTKESFIRTLAEFKNDKIISLEESKVAIKSMRIIRTLSELG